MQKTLATVTAHSPYHGNQEVPVVPYVCHRILALIEAEAGKLNMDTWHGTFSETGYGKMSHEIRNIGVQGGDCGTVHCIAGWAIHLAGQQGYQLEQDTDAEFAGKAILKAAGYNYPASGFYEAKEQALALLKETIADFEKR